MTKAQNLLFARLFYLDMMRTGWVSIFSLFAKNLALDFDKSHEAKSSK